MLVKRIDSGSIPVGLYEAGEDLVKGRAVVLKNGKVFLPSSADDLKNLMGFVTLVIDEAGGGDIANHDTIKDGKKCVVYSLIKNNIWGTTEFSGTLKNGDMLTVDYTTNKGKLVKVIGEGTALFQVFEMGVAGSYAMADVLVLDPKINVTVEVPLDKTALTVAIGSTESLSEEEYTVETWSVLETALAMPETTQAEIDAKVVAINEAVLALVEA